MGLRGRDIHRMDRLQIVISDSAGQHHLLWGPAGLPTQPIQVPWGEPFAFDVIEVSHDLGDACTGLTVSTTPDPHREVTALDRFLNRLHAGVIKYMGESLGS